MKLIDILRSQEKSIPGVLERPGPPYDVYFTDTFRRRLKARPFLLSVDDAASWQDLIDKNSQPLSDRCQYGVSDFWTFMQQRKYVWIGDHLLLTSEWISPTEPGLIRICHVEYCSNPWYLLSMHAREDFMVTSTQSTVTNPHTNAISLSGKVLQAYGSGRIYLSSAAGLNWIVQTNEEYAKLIISGFYGQKLLLPADQLQGLTSRAQNLKFSKCVFGADAADALCEGLGQSSAVLKTLSIEFGNSEDETESMVVFLQSLTSLFNRQQACSLTTLKIGFRKEQIPVTDAFFDALSNYQGKIDQLDVTIAGDSMIEQWKMIGWCKALVTSSNISEITFSCPTSLSYKQISRTSKHLLPALKNNKNIEKLEFCKRDKLFSAFHEEVASICRYRSARKKWANLFRCSDLLRRLKMRSRRTK